MEVREGKSFRRATGRGHLPLDRLGHGELVGGDGRGHAAGEQAMGKTESAGQLIGSDSGGGTCRREEANDELLDKIEDLGIVHGRRRRYLMC